MACPTAGSTSMETIPVRRPELLYVAILAIAQRALHKLGPDRRRRVGAFQVEVSVVVEPHPNHAQQFRWYSRRTSHRARCRSCPPPGCSGRSAARTPAAVPLRNTSSIRLVIR